MRPYTNGGAAHRGLVGVIWAIDAEQRSASVHLTSHRSRRAGDGDFFAATPACVKCVQTPSAYADHGHPELLQPHGVRPCGKLLAWLVSVAFRLPNVEDQRLKADI
jgi:hypothetical protein